MFMLPPITLLPVLFSTGMLSPVSMASFTLLIPSVTTPSSGTLAPGFTIIVSPTATSPVGTVSSLPSLKTTAVSGESSISFLIADSVFFWLLSSNCLPRDTSVITTATLS